MDVSCVRRLVESRGLAFRTPSADEGKVGIYPRVDQEVFMEFERLEHSGTFTVGRVSRGDKTVFLESAGEDVVWLFFVLEGLDYGQRPLDATPVDDDFLEGLSARDNGEIAAVLAGFVSERYFSVGSVKEDSVCLLEEGRFRVVFCDRYGIVRTISDDNDTKDIALMVLFNFAWCLW